MNLPVFDLPASLNYIGVFLTLECNLKCSYCINDPLQGGHREALFPIPVKSERHTMTPEQWIAGLSRIPFSADLPITLQGGEPMLYWQGKGVGLVLAGVPHYFDLLTNFPMKPDTLARNLNGQQAKLQRDAPYPSIRVSWHADEMNRVWGNGFEELVNRCEALKDHGFRVSPDKAESDIGIYMVAHPSNVVTPEMEAIFKGRVPFESKEFLGVDENQLHGHYLYPYSTDLISRGFSDKTLSCECRTSELLIDPLGFVWGCHYYLYESWTHGGPVRAFHELEAAGFDFATHADRLFAPDQLRPVGHLLDPAFRMSDLTIFRTCHEYGRCIGCDTKIKNNRFQSYYDQGVAHTSVEIRNIRMPEKLLAQLPADERKQPWLIPVAQGEA